MPRYIYDFAGIKMELNTPFEMKIHRESSPFMIISDIPAQESIRLVPVDNLPEMPSFGFWSDDHFFTTWNDIPAVFVRNYPGEAPYALLLEQNTVLELRYLVQYERYVSDSNSLLNLIGIERFLLRNYGFLLHASFISWQGRGILFSAPCGTGKSTQANLWERYESSHTINGDRAGVRFVNEKWTGYGVPFAGSSGVYLRESAPLAAIVTLAQGPENIIRRLRPKEAISKLLPEISCRRWDALFMNQLLNYLIQLVQSVPVYHLECRPDQGAVELLRDCLVREDRE